MSNNTTTTTVKRDYRQEVTDSIIKMLEQGTAPWQKPWRPGALEMPFNPTSEKQYRGGNAVHLMAIGVTRGYDDPRWMTYRQAQQNGWQVREGEKGTQIEYWEFPKASALADRKAPELSSDDGPMDNKAPRRMIHRVYTVFNAKQIEGVPDHRPKQHEEFEIVEAGESILQHSGAHISHDQNDRAFYNRNIDAIHLPPKAAFSKPADYYGTALHELGHWTGHTSRLNRETLNSSKSFGDENYAKEELRAELASVFLAAERGIPHDPANHAAYVGSWIKALQDDKNEIFRAAKDAHRATDFLLALEIEMSVEEALATAQDPQHRRETSKYVAEYEPSTATVNIQEKSTGTEERVMAPVDRDSPDSLAEPKEITENILDNEVPLTLTDLKQSFSQAQDFTRETLGDKARTFVADTESGIYRGAVIGETDRHLIQQLSDRSAVAHMKHLLDSVPGVGQEVAISYSRQVASVQEMPALVHEKELSR
jgi:antirestriction protein ArdC